MLLQGFTAREANRNPKETVVAEPDPIDVDVDVGANETGQAKPSNLGRQEFFLTLIGLLGVVMIIIAVVIWVNKDEGVGDSEVAVANGESNPSSTLGGPGGVLPADVPTTAVNALPVPSIASVPGVGAVQDPAAAAREVAAKQAAEAARNTTGATIRPIRPTQVPQTSARTPNTVSAMQTTGQGSSINSTSGSGSTTGGQTNDPTSSGGTTSGGSTTGVVTTGDRTTSGGSTSGGTTAGSTTGSNTSGAGTSGSTSGSGTAGGTSAITAPDPSVDPRYGAPADAGSEAFASYLVSVGIPRANANCTANTYAPQLTDDQWVELRDTPQYAPAGTERLMSESAQSCGISLGFES